MTKAANTTFTATATAAATVSGHLVVRTSAMCLYLACLANSHKLEQPQERSSIPLTTAANLKIAWPIVFSLIRWLFFPMLVSAISSVKRRRQLPESPSILLALNSLTYQCFNLTPKRTTTT